MGKTAQLSLTRSTNQPKAPSAYLGFSTVPFLNTDKAASIASMERVGRMIATYKAKFFINHDKAETDKLKLIPAFYD